MSDEQMQKLLEQLEKFNKGKKTGRIWSWILGWAAIGSAWVMFFVWLANH